MKKNLLSLLLALVMVLTLFAGCGNQTEASVTGNCIGGIRRRRLPQPETPETPEKPQLHRA